MVPHLTMEEYTVHSERHIKITVFLDVMLCSLVDHYWHFGETWYLTLQREYVLACSIPKMEAADSIKVLVLSVQQKW